MQSNPQLPCSSTNPLAPAKSNQKPFVILVSIAAVMIFTMTGCAGPAGSNTGATRYDSASPSENTSAGSSNTGGSMSTNSNTYTGSSNVGGAMSTNSYASENSSAGGDTATGTGGLAGVWSGTLRCDNGQTSSSVLKVSEAGNPVFEYESQSGAREVELTSSGQQVRYVPPGGGVVTLVVNSVAASSSRISFALNITKEKTAYETIDQSEGSLSMEATLSGSELEVVMRMRSVSITSQTDLVVPGDESQSVCRGRLRKG